MNAKELKNAIRIWESTEKKLKFFQRKTVDHVIELFTKADSTRRVLVSDEVGLGKTYIAKGVIDRLRIKQIENGKKQFKIAYICGNQVIARQNIVKLISDSSEGSNSDDRLSMQHLYLSEERLSSSNRFTRIVGMSPMTSFSLKGQSTGLRRERALIFATLKNAGFFDSMNNSKVSYAFMCQSKGDRAEYWESEIQRFESRIKDIEEKTGKKPYLIKYLNKHKKEIERSVSRLNLDDLKQNKTVIRDLRRLFALIGTEMIDVDLVIMDEFQRFPELIKSSDLESEEQLLAHKFLKNKESGGNSPLVLLLSATPYKSYQTRFDDEQLDNVSSSEFRTVTNFLTNNKSDVNEKWFAYGTALRNVNENNIDNVISIKRGIEDTLYGMMCRTERLTINISDSHIKPFKEPLAFNKEDVESFVNAHTFIEKRCRNLSHSDLPIVYSENIPFVFSFLRGYKIADKIRNNSLQRSRPPKGCCIPKEKVLNFEPLTYPNAKMRRIMDITNLKDETNNVVPYLLWLPPSFPYYKLGYPFNKAPENYSKTLIFSSWVMVPRCASSLLSYEADRRINKIYKKKVGQKMLAMTDKYRSEVGKNKFSEQIDPKNDSNFLLFYPSKTAASLWSNEQKNPNKSVDELKNQICSKITNKLQSLEEMCDSNKKKDKRWYYLALPLLDKKEDESLDFNQFVNERKSEIEQRFDRLVKEMDELPNNTLGMFPDDLSDYLTNIVIGSPANCLLRSLNNVERAYKVSTELVRYIFFGREPNCLLNALYKGSGTIDYTKAVCDYCIDGCFQSVIDEYVYMITDGNKDFDPSEIMINACCSASVIRINELTENMQKQTDKEKSSLNSFTCRFALCFATDKFDDKDAQRSANVRLAFNSPFKPFVLTSTSLGQEGLDFHHYCRKIVHWNLPNNPIDLEQREGRIDRYKSLFIRQNLASRYKDESFTGDVWDSLFNKCLDETTEEDKRSGLIPYWCLKEKEEELLIPIERHVLLYPFSKEELRYADLMNALANYRLTIGHPRQEELLYSTLDKIKEKDKLKSLFLDLSPLSRKE